MQYVVVLEERCVDAAILCCKLVPIVTSRPVQKAEDEFSGSRKAKRSLGTLNYEAVGSLSLISLRQGLLLTADTRSQFVRVQILHIDPSSDPLVSGALTRLPKSRVSTPRVESLAFGGPGGQLMLTTGTLLKASLLSAIHWKGSRAPGRPRLLMFRLALHDDVRSTPTLYAAWDRSKRAEAVS